MNKFMRKLLASTLCAAMVLGSALTAFAADTEHTTLPGGGTASTGEGKLEGYVTLDVTSVVLPTSWKTDFTLDPQGLLNKADSVKFTQGAGAVYFGNVSGGAIDHYSDKSDKLEIKNKSSYGIDVALKVGVKAKTGALSQIQLVSKSALSTTGPALYLGVLTSGTAIDITQDGQTVDTSAAAVPEVISGSGITDGYQLVATTTAIAGVTESPNGYYYYYALTPNYAPGAAQTIDFQLEGKTNTDEGWANVTEQVSTNITYTITRHPDGTKTMITGSAYSRSSTSNTYTVSFKGGVAQSISKIELSSAQSGSNPLVVPAGAYSLSGNTLTIDGTKNTTIGTAGVGNTRYFFVTFADGSKVSFAVSVKA